MPSKDQESQGAGQLSAATAHPWVTYRVAAEHESGARDGSIDLVTVAQALHWLNLPRFYGEARRVLKPGGVVAIWCYASAPSARPSSITSAPGTGASSFRSRKSPARPSQ
jgi:ubiquinone/menaquinone biosynthesis C-methylase UbiE